MGAMKWLAPLAAVGLLGAVTGAFDDGAGVESPETTVVAATMSTDVSPESVDAVAPESPASVPSTTVVAARQMVTAIDVPDGIDCDNAEELANSGTYEASDLADYCDNGPDPGDDSDEVDWDN